MGSDQQNSTQQPHGSDIAFNIPLATAQAVATAVSTSGGGSGTGQPNAAPIPGLPTAPFNGTINVTVNQSSNRIDGELVVPRALQQLPDMKHGGSLEDRQDWLNKVFTTLSLNESGVRWFMKGDVRLSSQFMPLGH